MRWLAVIMGVCLLVAGCRARVTDYEQVSPKERLVIKFSHVVAENTPKGAGALRFAQAVRERSGGRVEVQVYPNSQLYRDGEEFAALRDGSVQIIAPSTAKLVQIHPAWQVFDLPYLFRNFEDVERLFTSKVGFEMRQALEAKGFIPLVTWSGGFREFTNSRKPLVSPSDFAGITFRVQPSPVIVDELKLLGASATPTGFDSVYAALERRELEGQENTLSNFVTRNLHEVQPYLTLSDHGYLAYVVLVNGAWWQGLQPEEREMLREALAEATQVVRDRAKGMNDEALVRIQSSGRVKVYAMTPQEREALRVALSPVYKGTAERVGKSFLDQVTTVVGAEQ